MKRMGIGLHLSGLVILVLFLMNCASFTTFQTPEVLKEGEFSVGVGGAGLLLLESSGPRMTIGSADLFARYGLGADTDIGFKLSGIFPFLVAFGDIKHQFLKKPLALSADMGVSLFAFDEYRTVGLYPMMLAGVKPFFAGVRLTYLIMGKESSTGGSPFFASGSEVTALLPSVVLGMYLGDRFQIIPEINFYQNFEGESFYFLGLGFQYKWGDSGKRR